jgi:hypothetical protein
MPKLPADTPYIEATKDLHTPHIERRSRRRKPDLPRVLRKGHLDGRTSAAKLFDQLTGAIEADLGGADQLSAIERNLVQAFAGAAVTLHHLNARLMAGHEINLAQHAQAVTAMVRVASRLGLQRRQKNVGGLTLGDLLRADIEERQRAADAEEAAEDDDV